MKTRATSDSSWRRANVTARDRAPSAVLAGSGRRESAGGLRRWAGAAAGMVLGCLLSSAQTAVDLRSQSKAVDFSNAAATAPFKTGTSLPAVCRSGEAFFLTTAPAGSNWYGCVAANTWTLQGGPADPALVKSSGGRDAYHLITWDSSGNAVSAACTYEGGKLSCGDGLAAAGLELPELASNGTNTQSIYGANSQSADGCVIWPTGSPANGEVLAATGSTETPAGTALTCVVLDWVAAGGGTSGVSSIFGRTGAVTAQAGDYAASLVTNAAAGGIGAATVQDAINELDTEKLSVSGNAATATALAANGANCPAGQAARGVDAGGNAEECFIPGGGGAGHQMFTWYSGSAVGANSSLYFWPGSITATSGDSYIAAKLPFAMTFDQPYLRISTTQAAGCTLTMRFVKNNTIQSGAGDPVVTVAEGQGDGWYTDAAHSISYAAGDTVTLVLQQSNCGAGSPTVRTVSFRGIAQ